ncbi:MAG TPA: two-component regulator propeller domain-containing protein, partial [Thermoanaerobaculia bacterium]|nr:two-component regulator propeller domain-containing protein [Thermoanaerobaculia bacterium]
RLGFERFDERDGLTSLRIASLFENRDGEVCNFANAQRADQYDDGFLQCYDGRRFRTRKLRLPPGTKLGWGWAQVSFQDSRGEWWVPTLSGLFRFPAVPFDALDETAPIRVYTKRDGLPDDQVYRVFEDRRGDLWIGFIDGRDRLARWERASGAIRTFGPADGVADREPMAFAEDASASVWIGFRGGGLARWRDGRIAWFDGRDGLPGGSIRALYRDGEGRLWIGSSSDGLARIDRPGDPTPRFARLGVADGLSSASISTIVQDRFGRIYAGTERWLDRIEPATGNVQHFTADDGLAHGVVQSSLRDRAGTLWFGSFEGLSRLRPAPEAGRSPPPVRILRALVNGVRQPLSDIGATDVGLRTRLPEPASVQIDFVALDFAPGGRPRYEYRMDGIDRSWSAPAEQRSVVYARLPAGGYRFRVRAVSNDGSIGTDEAEVRFAVLPSFWKRREVIAALALAAVAIALALHRVRLKSALAVERVRSRVARDLHDDVGAGLSEIAILSEVAAQNAARNEVAAQNAARNGVAAQDEGRPLRSDTALHEIGDSARRLVDAMSDIVWSTDPRQDDAASLVARIRHFAANTLDGRRIAWTLDVPPQFEDRPLDAETRRQLLLIVKEALTNVARHSGCSRVSVRIAPASRDVAIEIADDGRGFAPSDGNGAGGHGLANMRSRAESLGGSLRVESVPAAGTRVLLRVPLGGGSRRRPSA